MVRKVLLPAAGVYICGHAYAWGPLGWLYPCEIQPLETRAAGAGINTASNMVSAGSLPSSMPGLM